MYFEKVFFLILTIVFSQLSAQVISVTTTSTDVSCNGSCDGMAIATATGCVGGPCVYLWNGSLSPAQANDTAIGLCPGTYIVSVSDPAMNFNSDTVIINEPPALDLTISSTDVSCNGLCDGGATATATGGTAPYYYVWDLDTIQSITGLCAGIFTLTVIESNGCVTIDSVTINEPAPLVSSIISSDVSCNGDSNGTIYLTVSGGSTPYVYNWSNGDTIEDITGLTAGPYTIIITDFCGNVVSDTIVISEPAALITNISSTDVSCYGYSNGFVDLIVYGGVLPYNYFWSNNDTTEYISELSVGIYMVTVTDYNGCIAIDSSFISEPSVIIATMSSTPDTNNMGVGTATISVIGGTLPYSYQWDDNNLQTTNTAYGLTAGTYNVVVTDTNGCINGSGIVISNISSIFEISLENNVKVYPNPFTETTTIEIINANKNFPLSLILYDHLGKIVNNIIDIRKEKFEISRQGLPDGVYFYKIIDNKGNLIKGKFVIQ